MPTPSNRESQEDHKLMAVVVEEVDEAREVYELARQLAHALPLNSFEDVVKAVGSAGTITFRGGQRPVRNFAAYVPGVLFPIDSVEKLVALLYETVRLAPSWVKYDESDPKYAKRKLRRLGILGIRQGILGSTGRFGSTRSAARAGGADRSQKTEARP